MGLVDWKGNVGLSQATGVSRGEAWGKGTSAKGWEGKVLRPPRPLWQTVGFKGAAEAAEGGFLLSCLRQRGDKPGAGKERRLDKGLQARAEDAVCGVGEEA